MLLVSNMQLDYPVASVPPLWPCFGGLYADVMIDDCALETKAENQVRRLIRHFFTFPIHI